MDFGAGTYALGLGAGVLSTLSPCVLPLLPIILGTAVAAHRFGPLALAAGLIVSFTVVGLFVATIGFTLGLDAEWFRRAAAALLIAFGALMLSARLQYRFARSTASLSAAGDSVLARINHRGLGGQLAIGLLLGLVWAPCVGPTLGAASTLAAQGRDLPQVALVMLAFGLGAGLPLVALGALSRTAMLALRGRMLAVGRTGKVALGVILVGLGALILTGLDKRLEAFAVRHSPAWLTDLSTTL